MKSEKRKGKTHPIHDIIQESRKVFIDMGFDEIENQIFVPEDDVYKQYGSEAPIILDRCYYLAGLPRPDIGLGKKQMDGIRGINPDFDIDEFKNILREYRRGSVEGDDLAEEMVNRLRLNMNEALRVIDLIPEFRSITPVPSKITLRSHMTASWFPTLQAMQETCELPLRLFSTGLRFRREQKVDSTHLRVHYGASCVVMDDSFDINDGKKLSAKILGVMDFRNIKLVRKKATSNYYEKDTEFEVYSGDIEIADCGMYSGASLSNYGIKCPVFNLGFGLERILLIRNKAGDIREILYPQFYRALELNDEEIAGQVEIDRKPETKDGKKLLRLMKDCAEKHADEDSPCKIQVYDGRFLGGAVKVYLTEKEKNKKLLGPAALNEVYVYQGSVYGIPREPGKLGERIVDVRDKGTYAGFSCLDAILNLFVSEIEKVVGGEKGTMVLQVKMAKTPADMNIIIGDVARRFITSQNREIYLKGPVFTAVEVVLD
jgi:O-phosphoseryl-tRNA synthetase